IETTKPTKNHSYQTKIITKKIQLQPKYSTRVYNAAPEHKQIHLHLNLLTLLYYPQEEKHPHSQATC
ncbi:hypothetical protein VBQ01_16135, partial [Klebsiella pneumoniae]|nr:hypothetical protein [Klebsiella pneumoniae]